MEPDWWAVLHQAVIQYPSDPPSSLTVSEVTVLLVSSYQMGNIIDKVCGFNGLSLEMAYMVEG